MPGFDIVPVLDLMGGQVVHARAGDRERYRPLRSILAGSAAPVEVVEGLLALHPFRRLYIADLDAIRGRGDHCATIRALRDAFPTLELWVDAGFKHGCEARRFLGAKLGSLVLGSESQRDLALLETLRADPNVILSLDFKGAARLGPPALFAEPERWPDRVVVMSLAAVGGVAGPDLARLEAIRGLRPDRLVYAAGGVRGRDDLAQLRRLGCAGVLVASALHDGRLGAGDLA